MKVPIFLFLCLMFMFMAVFGYMGYYASIFWKIGNPDIEFSFASVMGQFIYLSICMWKDVRLS